MLKKALSALAIATLALSAQAADVVLKVAASSVPHAEILNFVKPQLKAEGISTAEQGGGVSFLLEDKDDTGKTLLVVYRGQVPDTFKAGAEVIVEGGMSPEGRFKAKTLMTKCPSKYQKENRG